MDNPEWLDVFQVVFTIVAGLYLIMGIARFIRNSQGLNGYINAALLNESSEIDSYVKFKGRFSGQQLKSPLSKEVCSYWSLTVRAEFETKRKKPGSGMETHRPTIHRDNSDGIPLLISDGKQIVQMVLKYNLSVMGNPRHKQRINSMVPFRGIEKLAKAKYEKYISDEYYCPFNAEVTVWGNILEKNKNSVLLSYDKVESRPPLILLGDESQLKESFAAANQSCIFSIVCSNFFILSIWTWMGDLESVFGFIVIAAIASVIAFFILRGTKPELKSEGT